ncbi:MAG: metalloregulator ArsR/SmtB family transcription factor [Actinomycetota bacterium]|nr:metalloregulator ArsR/SmtB family transcription factor [Actinomycetota bacterium]
MTSFEDPHDTGHEHQDPVALIQLEPVDIEGYRPASELLKVLTAPVRLALVEILAGGPRCVHELVDALSVTQPLVSQHLKVLRAARIVSTSRRGREVVYRLEDEHVHGIITELLAHARE